MIGPNFYINGTNYQFYLNKRTWQWHVHVDYKKTNIQFSKSKGDAIIEFLEQAEKLEFKEH